MNNNWILPVMLLCLVAFLLWDDYNIRHQIENGKTDTVHSVRVVVLDAPPIDIDTVPAVLVLKSQLTRTMQTLFETRKAMQIVSGMYEDALNKSKFDSLVALPTARLDTVICRDVTFVCDTIHTEYVFPPVNAFINTHIGLAPFSKMIQDTSFTKTVVLSPSLWQQVRSASPMVLVGILIRELALLVFGR